MGRSVIEETYLCDHCGEPHTARTLIVYRELPYDTDDKNTGDTGQVCITCNLELSGAA